MKGKRFVCSIFTFDVKWDVFLKSEFEFATPEGNGYLGMTYNLIHEIHIRDDLDVQMMKEVVYHEVTHAFNFSMYNNKQEFTHEEMCDFIGRYGNNIHDQSQNILQSIGSVVL